jgi:hypothetical protein
LGNEELPAVGLPEVHVIVLALNSTASVEGVEPNNTDTLPACAAGKLPVIVTAVPPSVLPLVGVTLDTIIGVRLAPVGVTLDTIGVRLAPGWCHAGYHRCEACIVDTIGVRLAL